MVCWLADDGNPQLEEIVINFEITNKGIFSVAGRISSLVDVIWLKDLKRWCLSTTGAKMLNADYFRLINI